MSEDDLSHALRAFDRGQSLPIVDADKFTEVRSWLRRLGNDKLLVLAASLWAGGKRGLRGVTLEWLATDFLRYQLKIAGSDNELQWQAETLALSAKEAGLLCRSTEWNDPRTYAYQDEQANPSFDMGPMVWLIGRLVQNFQRTQPSMLGLQGILPSSVH